MSRIGISIARRERKEPTHRIAHVVSADHQDQLEVLSEMTAMGLAAKYASAVWTWIKAGRPTRSQQEIAAIHEQHCLPCDRYDQEKKACKSCGCQVNDLSFPLVNKIAMATERCPEKHW